MQCKKCKNEIPDGSIYCNYCGVKQITERRRSASVNVPAPRQLPSGKWFIQLRINGKSIPITEATEKECRAAATLIKAEYKTGKRVDTGARTDMTLRSAIDQYITERGNTLSPSTIRGYRGIQRTHLLSAMDKKIREIDNWQALFNEEAAKYSAKTMANTHGLISSVLKNCGCSLPDMVLPQIVKNEHPWLTPDQIVTFVDAVAGTKYEIPSLLALHSLRRSEIFAMTWDDIDLDKGKIFVRGAVVQNEHEKYVLKDTNKNTTSRRVVPIMIPALTVRMQEAHDAQTPMFRCAPSTLCRAINRICNERGLPAVGTHGLRHSFASLAHHLGMPEAECMRLGGWADNQTMHKIYLHLAESDIEKHTNAMTLFYKNANENANKDKIS